MWEVASAMAVHSAIMVAAAIFSFLFLLVLWFSHLGSWLITCYTLARTLDSQKSICDGRTRKIYERDDWYSETPSMQSTTSYFVDWCIDGLLIPALKP